MGILACQWKCRAGMGTSPSNNKSLFLCAQTWDRLIDLQRVVREMYPGQDKIGLKHLVWQFLGFWPPKGSEITLGDWEAPWLSRAQINYAILDALYVGEIFRWMRCIQV